MNTRDLLAKTLMAEAGGEGLGGMLAAGAVINNRVKAGGYGSGVNGVIMKPGQFSAWNSVTGYAGGQGGLDMANMRPNADAYKAADMLLSGEYSDPTGGATHYYNPAVANPKWGASAGGEWKTIGNHIFGFADAGRGTKSLAGGAAKDTLPSPEAAPMQNPVKPEQAGGLFGMLFPNATRDQQDRVAMGLMSMSHSPNPGMMNMVQGRINERRDDRKEAKAKAKVRAKENQTAKWLAGQPGGQQFAEAIAQGALPAGAALDLWREGQSGSDKTSLQKNYATAVEQGFKGTILEYQLALKKAGAAQNNITNTFTPGTPDSATKSQIPIDPDKLAEETAKSDAKALSTARELASVAEGQLLELETIKGIVDGGFNSGALSGARGVASAISADLLGRGGEYAAQKQTFDSSSSRLAMDQLKALGGNDTERELLIALSTAPSPDKEPAANKAILRKSQAAAEILSAKPGMMQSWIAEHGSLSRPSPEGKSWEQAWSEYQIATFRSMTQDNSPAEDPAPLPAAAPEYLNQSDTTLWEYFTDEEKRAILESYQNERK